MPQPTTVKPLLSLEDVVFHIKETLRYVGNIATVRAAVIDIASRLTEEKQDSNVTRAARLLWYDLLLDDCTKWYVRELKERMR